MDITQIIEYASNPNNIQIATLITIGFAIAMIAMSWATTSRVSYGGNPQLAAKVIVWRHGGVPMTNVRDSIAAK